MVDIFSLLQNETVALAIKIIVLIFIGLYLIMVFIIFNHLRSLNKIVYFEKSSLSQLLQVTATVYLLLTASLFLLAVVIL